ncbi:FHA domain-containing protein [Herminiimonas sp. KBW02]|uniref:FHA domain-containing protein n=1 Tax=Herminiimonas sp. KBW02 TaxID=2153363 RepID=UPI000F5B0F48|nr:FHA domain-containing protein [Herminiimonas sp. KBW02]RQO38738.1 FHA domain-containing protein [Herminiimonas sp. KBW02]
MPTIILAKDGIALQEFPLSKERTSIGRRAYNDIVIDAAGISGEHAVIISHPVGCYFEDLGSTNGSQLKGQGVTKHFLEDGDVIALATYTIQYCAHASIEDSITVFTDNVSRLEDLGDIQQITEPSYRDSIEAIMSTTAVVKILNGASAGKEVVLNKVLTTIGRPGRHVAVFAISPQGYSLTHVEGDEYPVVNGTSIGTLSQPLNNGDQIHFSGTDIVFMHEA